MRQYRVSGVGYLTLKSVGIHVLRLTNYFRVAHQ
jgi:hypothetical protein